MQFLIDLGTGEGMDEWSFPLRWIDLVNVHKVEEKQKGKRGGVGAWGSGVTQLPRWSLPAWVAPQKN